MKIYNGLLGRGIHARDDAGAARKKTFHADGKKFLKDLAKELGLTGKCEIKSNQAGREVSGDVFLQADTLFICMNESGNGVKVLYRRHRSRQDTTGMGNNWVTMHELSHSEMRREDFINSCKEWVDNPVPA